MRFTLVDNGLFTELAFRLAREGHDVNYAVGWEAEFPVINDRIVGAGSGQVTRVEDPYLLEIVEQTDVYVFPDLFHAGKQQMLERLGKKVWGGRTGDELETKRIWFWKLQKELGLPVAEATVIQGMSNLRSFLKDHGHCFVKTTPKIRGSWETFEHKDYEQSEYFLDQKTVLLGGSKELVEFLIEEPIESPFETGLDTYSIDGRSPKTPMQGIEIKGQLILCSAQTKSPTPKPLDDALSALAPILKERRYRNFLSAEFRTDILTDICCRCPNPGIGCEMEMISNIPEIIARGADGELVEPEFEAEFGIQAAIYHEHDKELWKQFRIPEELRRWVKLMEFCEVDGRWQIIPRPPYGEKIGWLVGIGDTIDAAADHLQANAEMLKDLPIEIKIGSLPEAIKQAHEMEKIGLEFTDQPIPEPDEVLAEPS